MTKLEQHDDPEPGASTTMTQAERERFLAEVHVGVVHVADGDRTLAVPVWYDYSPAIGVSVITTLSSRKGSAISAAGRFGLVAQIEHGAYRYVSVEGPVVESRPCEHERDLVSMAVRYLGPSAGERYAAAWRDAGDDIHVFTIRPEQWFAADIPAAALGVRPDQLTPNAS